MDQKYIDLFDLYTHGLMKRREFLERLAGLAGGTAAAATLLGALQNDYARADMVPVNDPRLHVETVPFTVNQTKAAGYLAKQKTSEKAPGVMVIHENRGLNPHIKDVTRRFALEGFIAF